MMCAEILEQVLQAVNPNGVCLAHHLRVTRRTGIGGSDRDVVCLGAQIIKAFLNGYSNSAATAPEADQKIRLETCFVNIGRQPKRVPEQVVCGDKSLCHFCYSQAVLR
jgi:hypothetical protein